MGSIFNGRIYKGILPDIPSMLPVPNFPNMINPTHIVRQYQFSFPGINRPEHSVDHPPVSSTEVKDKVELYLFSPCGPSWPVQGWILLLPKVDSHERLYCVIRLHAARRSRRSCRIYTAILWAGCKLWVAHTRVGTLIVATIYLHLIQNRYMFRSFTVLQCSHQHCVQPVASDMEVVGYL